MNGNFLTSRPTVASKSSARICVVEDNMESGDSGLRVPVPSTTYRGHLGSVELFIRQDELTVWPRKSRFKAAVQSQDWHVDRGTRVTTGMWTEAYIESHGCRCFPAALLSTIVANRNEVDLMFLLFQHDPIGTHRSRWSTRLRVDNKQG